MFYQPDVDDENARMDAEQDAKLERAMADREDDESFELKRQTVIPMIDKMKVRFKDQDEARMTALNVWLKLGIRLQTGSMSEGLLEILADPNDDYFLVVNTPIEYGPQIYILNVFKGKMLGYPMEVSKEFFIECLEDLTAQYPVFNWVNLYGKTMYPDVYK